MFGIPEWAIGVGFIVVAVSFAKALTRRSSPDESANRLRGRKASRRDLARAIDDIQGKAGDTEELQRRLGELEDVQRRLAEVEERLDFAERLLTKQRDVERLTADKK